MARAMRRRLRAGDLVHNSFSYHLTPGGLDDGKRRPCAGLHHLPGGVGNTELQLQAMPSCGPTPTSARPAS
jgi:phenylacetate-CoA ligase